MGDEKDIFADAERRQRRLFQELAAASTSNVVAVVGPNCPGGEDLWTMSFDLEAWRVDGGRMQTRPLTARTRSLIARGGQEFSSGRIASSATCVVLMPGGPGRLPAQGHPAFVKSPIRIQLLVKELLDEEAG
jgi:hypothetical protein